MKFRNLTFNIKSVIMKHAFNNIISVIYSFIKFCFIKIFHWKGFKYSLIERFSPNTDIYFLGENAKIVLGSKVRAHTLCRLRVVGKGQIYIGDNTTMNYGCMITSRNKIQIGQEVEFGPNVLLYDHDHDYKCKGGLKAGKYTDGEITIGDNSWIGANVVILKNTKLGKNCVVAAGSVIGNCEYPDNTVIYQKRETLTKSFTLK